ncbi:MAG: glutathione S-transferase family protein [Deltaproteobacteria bacterium]|nr:MAG: glutathione S-transferase family protein [Deltaproteobacteria bacterium]
MDRPVLWQFTYSHFNEKARWALDFKRVPHVRRSLLPGPHAVKIRRMTGQSAVPVLELDGSVIYDSTRIIAALEEAYPDPPLYPSDDADRRRALELEDFFDHELGPHIRRLAFHLLLPHANTVVAMFSQESGRGSRMAYRAAFPMIRVVMQKAMRIDDAGADLGRAKTVAALDRVARELGPSGYLVGDRFTVADLTAAALFSPLVAPPEFPYPPPSMPESVLETRRSLSGHPAFQWVLETYRRHRGRSAAVPA